ncbi:MAG: DUF4352 domain-containing protein [Acutalibacteraceae bacterium]
MKKFICLLLAVIMTAFFAACTGNSSPQKETAQDRSSESVISQEQGEDVFNLNDTAVFQDLKFTATEITESNGTEFFTPDDGNVFVGVKFTIENISEQEQNVSSILLFDGYADDIKCDYSFNAACAFDEGTLDGDIAPGKKLVGWYALEVPANWSNIELTIKSDWLSNTSAKFVFTKQF